MTRFSHLSNTGSTWRAGIPGSDYRRGQRYVVWGKQSHPLVPRLLHGSNWIAGWVALNKKVTLTKMEKYRLSYCSPCSGNLTPCNLARELGSGPTNWLSLRSPAFNAQWLSPNGGILFWMLLPCRSRKERLSNLLIHCGSSPAKLFFERSRNSRPWMLQLHICCGISPDSALFDTR